MTLAVAEASHPNKPKPKPEVNFNTVMASGPHLERVEILSQGRIQDFGRGGGVGCG